MDLKKLPLTLIVLTFLAVSVFAVSVNYESPISQGQQWNLTINVSSLSEGESEKLFVGEEELYVIANIDGKIIGYEKSSRVLWDSVSNSNVTLTISGYSEGKYDIEIGDVSEQIEFFTPVSKSEQDALESKLDSLKSELSSLNLTISNLESEIDSKDDQINALKNENASLLSSLHSVESKILNLEEEGKSKEEIIEEVKDDLNLLLTERAEARESPLYGMFAFGTQNSDILIGFIAIAAILVIGFFVYNSRSSSIYSSSIFGNDNKPETSLSEDSVKNEKKGFFSNFIKKDVDDDVEETSNTKKGKWAVESYSPKESNSKEEDVDFGDLIKRK
jgi:outer membrane murein-binding lipoprotein Lpp